MVTEKSCNILRPLQALTSSTKNYSNYRGALRIAVPPCIPFLGKSKPQPNANPTPKLRKRDRPLPKRSNIHRRRKPTPNTRWSDKLPQIYNANSIRPRNPALQRSTILPTRGARVTRIYRIQFTVRNRARRDVGPELRIRAERTRRNTTQRFLYPHRRHDDIHGCCLYGFR